MDQLASGNFSSARFDAAAALLADDLRTASQDFEGALQTYIWSREYDGGFGAIENGRVFEERLARFLNGARRIVEVGFPKLVSIASQQREMTVAVKEARAIITSAVREHCSPKSILRRAFPDLTGEGIDLPPGLGPPEASDPVEEISSRINTSLNSSVDRIANQTLADGVSNAGVSTNEEPAGTKQVSADERDPKPGKRPNENEEPAEPASRHAANLDANLELAKWLHKQLEDAKQISGLLRAGKSLEYLRSTFPEFFKEVIEVLHIDVSQRFFTDASRRRMLRDDLAEIIGAVKDLSPSRVVDLIKYHKPTRTPSKHP